MAHPVCNFGQRKELKSGRVSGGDPYHLIVDDINRCNHSLFTWLSMLVSQSTAGFGIDGPDILVALLDQVTQLHAIEAKDVEINILVVY